MATGSDYQIYTWRKWESNLKDAAQRFDGGHRSFSSQRDADFALNSYEAPNQDYVKLLRKALTVSSTSSTASEQPYSAGWLIPDKDSVCKPVLVAHSIKSAIWLLWTTFPEDALPESVWKSLEAAADKLSYKKERRAFLPWATHPAQHSQPRSQTAARDSSVPNPRSSYAWNTTEAEVREQVKMRGEQGLPAAKRPRVGDSPGPSAQVPLRVSSAEDSPSDDSDQSLLQEPVRITTVTNHNRRAERNRAKRLEAMRAQRRVGLGLVKPSGAASSKEIGAHASISEPDVPVISWIFKQEISDAVDFFTKAGTPYVTATTFLEKARALGNSSSQYNAAQFLQAWRERGSPFRSQSSPAISQQQLQPQNYVGEMLRTSGATEEAFCRAWKLATRIEGELAAVHIEYRWAEALVGRAYEQKIAEIKQHDLASSNDRTHNRYGKGPVRSEAINSLLRLVNPSPTAKEREDFQIRLKKASRWYTIAKALGWGVLALMPHDVISNTWIEQALRAWSIDVWINLVKKERADVFAASKALEDWLGPESISGGPINGKRILSIEAAPVKASVVEEIVDSEDSDDDGISSSNSSRAVLASQPRRSLGQPSSTPRMRQLNLLELFHPVVDDN